MTGKVLTIAIVIIGIATAISVYYLQVFHFYETVDADRAGIAILRNDADDPAMLIVRDYAAIDASSSPIRYRACFSYDPTEPTDALLPAPGAEPLNAPFWFDCFDADALGAALASGAATAYLGQKNVAYGADRIVALTRDGRGYVWHQLNNCGEMAYDGTQVGEDCPER